MTKDSQNNTKDRFVGEALRLFAQYGYDSVSVAQIASAVGCTAPALYKHFPSKQALLDAIVERSKAAYAERMIHLQEQYSLKEQQCGGFLWFAESQQITMLKRLFCATLHGEYTSLFRKLVSKERDRRPELAQLYNRRYYFDQVDYMEQLMRQLIDVGIMRDADPRMLAVEYVSPVCMLIDVCDLEPAREEEAMRIIEAHVRQFNRVYRLK